jgi:RHS repeat-associated protein
MKSFLCLFSCVVVLFAASFSYAQVSIGNQPLGSFASSPDVTNLGNLNVHYTFPVFSKPGRGMPFNYSLSFDNSIWSPVAGVWTPVANWGWRDPTGAFAGAVFSSITTRHCTDPDTGNQVFYTFTTFRSYQDNFGTVHPVVGAFYIQDSICGPGSSQAGTTTDGSGFTVTPGSSSSAQVTSRSGQIVNRSSGVGFGTGSFTDTNGNTISESGGVFTDTLGMTPLTASGGSPSPLVFAYKDTSGTSRNVTFNYTSYTVKTHFNCTGVTDYGPTTVSLVSSIVYPDGSSYSFTYEPTPGFTGDVTGRLKMVTLPTGGTITYSYTGGSNGIECADGSTSGFDRATSDGTISYSRSGSGAAWTTTIQDATPVTRNQTVINFQTVSSPALFLETHRSINQGISTELVHTDTCYNGSAPPCITTAVSLPFTEISNYVTPFSGSQSRTSTFINAVGLPTEVDEYDFGGTTPLRKTITTYAPLGNNILDRPSSIVVQDGASTQKASTTSAYDEVAPTGTTGVPQHSAITGSRGNLTTLGGWLDATNTFLTTTFAYDDTGNVLIATDPGGHHTQFSYTDNFSDGVNRNSAAFVTQVTFPDTTSPNLAHHATHTRFEPNTGLPSSITDQNGQQTAFTYDLLLRLLQASVPDSGQTSYSYPSTAQIVMQKKIDSSHFSYATSLLDSYGRLSRSALANAESTPYDLADICYDSNGRQKFQSYSYQAASYTGASVCSGAGDGFAYDALGRLTKVTHSDGSSANISFTGRAQQFSDEGNGSFNVTRISQSNALGQLTAVCEVSAVTLLGNGGTPTGCGLDIPATGFLTSFAYNTLGNLTTVTQGSLANRTFAYDSLSRLTSESEPEWGSGSTMSYTYNGDSLLTQRTRPAPNQTSPTVTVNTTYAYDELHRPRTQTYSDGTTQQATFNYDESNPFGFTASNTVGRVTSEIAGNAKSAFSYDVMGRVLSNWQCTPQTCPTPSFYQLSYAYDLLGDPTTASNGVGVTFSYAYNAAPRMIGITSNLVDSTHPATLLSSVHYGQFGPISDTLGNGLNEIFGYNAYGALQSYASTPYSFSLGFASNWNVSSAADSVNGNWSYGYDQFNRLASSNKNSGAQTFSYVYDRYGNRLQQNAPQGGPAPQYVFDNNNRIVGSGVTYDAVGNVMNDGFHSYTYDAESRLVKVDGGTTATYVYDAEGRRVHAPSYESVYDLGGRPMTLFNLSGGWAFGEIYASGRHLATYSGATTNFLHADWLGTRRVMSGVSGANSETCTGLAFADGVNCTGTNWNFNVFTDDVHDYESNLEHTWFRQLSGTQGRWTSPDPYLGSMSLANPQSLNRYGYVLGDPLGSSDLLGLQLTKLPCSNSEGCQTLCKFHNVYIFGIACDLFLDSLSGLNRATGGGSCLPPGVQGPPSADCLSEPTIKKTICSLIPNGRTTGVSGSLGGLFGPTGTGEMVRNWDTGEVSFFGSAGVSGGLVGAGANVFGGPVWGLSSGNSNYKSGSTTVSGSGTYVGGSVSFNSPGTHDVNGSLNPKNFSGPVSLTVSLGVSNLPYSGGVSVTNYSNPKGTTTSIPPTGLADILGALLRGACRP